jgi:hypothetical protein
MAAPGAFDPTDTDTRGGDGSSPALVEIPFLAKCRPFHLAARKASLHLHRSRMHLLKLHTVDYTN